MSKHNRHMRNFLVRGTDQMYYGVIFIAVAAASNAGVVVLCALAYLGGKMDWCASDGGGLCAVGMMRDVFDSVREASPSLPLLGALTAINLVISFVLGIIVSHRTFGPWVPLLRHIENLKARRFDSRVTLRKGDHLRALADKLNELAASLEGEGEGKSDDDAA